MKNTFARIAGIIAIITAIGACDSIETFPGSDNGSANTDTTDSADTSTSVDVAPLPCAGKVCDDKNDCTIDKCDEVTGACVNQKQTGVLCTDGNACTEGDMCADGKCSGTAKDCEDGNKCTLNGCDAKTGKCASQEKTGCVPDETCKDSDCTDNNACTDDFCNAAGQCVHVNDDGNTCVDDNKCTTGDSCKAGVCSGAAKSCNDNNACTNDVCDPNTGECVFTPVSNQWKQPCNDLSEATVNDICIDGKCIGTIPAPTCVAANCDDGNKCTTDYCSAAGACAHATTTADGAICAQATSSANYMCQSGICQAFLKPECTYNTDCSDKNWCTDDFCIAGKCKWNAKVCNDGNSCTMDSCDPQASTTQGCVYTAIPGCGLPAPECSLNSQCNDNQPCTDDACVAGKCSHEWQPFCCGTSADCTSNGGCLLGTCLAGSCNFFYKDCNDSNACTADSCSAGVCLHKPIQGCSPPQCSFNTDCSDGNGCTLDLCEAGKCKYVPETGKTCNDNNACTISDICIAGAFCSGTPKSCNDSDPCTTDSCNSTNGQCVNSAVPSCVAPCTIFTNCSDNNVCTKDSCNAGSGACENMPITCNDNNACTSDSCNANTGCVYTAIPGCGVVDPCAGKVCNDNNPCTADTCSAGTCSFTPIPGCGAPGPATSLTITHSIDAGLQSSFQKKGVDTYKLWIECKQSANEFLNETEQIPWFVYATAGINATSLSKNFSTKALTECKVNLEGTKQGQSVIWSARGGDQDFPGGKALQGTVSYTWNGISVINVAASSNGQGGYDRKFSPGGDSDGDGINDIQDAFAYDGSK